MEFPFKPELVDAAAKDFDAVVHKIRNKNFAVVIPPERSICKECDIRNYCVAEGTIR